MDHVALCCEGTLSLDRALNSKLLSPRTPENHRHRHSQTHIPVYSTHTHIHTAGLPTEVILSLWGQQLNKAKQAPLGSSIPLGVGV